MSTNDFGKKVFFLYPHSVIEFDLIQTLIEEEYEVYILKDYKKVKLLMQKYKDSILFINIDEVLNEQEWYEYTQNLIESTRDFNTQIGILTYNENQDLTQKYLMDLGVTCGFIQLKLGKNNFFTLFLT